MMENFVHKDLISNLVPVVTPFNEDMSVDLESATSHAIFLKEAGVRAVVIGGTTGEGLALNSEEKTALCSLFSELGFLIIGCISSFDWVSTLDSIRAFSSAKYLLAMPPMFIRPSNEDIVDFFNFVEEHSGKKLILYNNPARTGVDISKMYSNFSNVLGVKETKFDLIPNMPWWCGEDSLAVRSMELGAAGLISACANAFPTIASKICNRSQSDEEASKWLKYSESIFKASNPLGVKYLLKKKGIIRSEKTRFSIKIRNSDLLDRIELDDIK